MVTYKEFEKNNNIREKSYEPDELPLLYLAIWGANVGFGALRAKTNFIFRNLS